MTWQSKLLRWYRQQKRDLPWRRNPTPYRVLVSEIMLQQTTVKTVIPYYRRFLKKFPSLKSLATSSETDVLQLWSGLGYYARARNLRRIAQICASDFRGRVPKDVSTLQTLPGIGAYTAGAIASIAYDQRAALVDGNVARVLARYFAISADPKTTAGQKKFWQLAEQKLPRRYCGDFNQALMELGATICTPLRPSCPLCPLRSDCSAYQEDRVAQLPRLAKRIQYRSVQLTAALIMKRGRLLMLQRPAKGVLRDMWEFPVIEGDLDSLQAAYQWQLPEGRALRPVRHAIMDQRITIQPWLFELNGELNGAALPTPRSSSRWVQTSKISALPTSSMIHKLTALLASDPTRPT